MQAGDQNCDQWGRHQPLSMCGNVAGLYLLVSGCQILVPGIWCPVSGIRHQPLSMCSNLVGLWLPGY